MLKIYLDQKFQWPMEGLNGKSLVYKVVTWPTISYTNKSRAQHYRSLKRGSKLKYLSNIKKTFNKTKYVKNISEK